MAERIIGIGETSSFRYFAIQPPLEDVEAKALIDTLQLPFRAYWPMNFTQERRADSPDHTEFGIDVGAAIDWIGLEEVDGGAVEIAQQIASILAQQGDDVVVLEDIVSTSWEAPIFGQDADHQRELAEYFRSHPEQE